MPCGLKNIGNTCYFNSLIQVLFFMPNFQEKVLNFDLESQWKDLKSLEEANQVSETEKIKIAKSRHLVGSL